VLTNLINKILVKYLRVRISRSRPTFEQARNSIIQSAGISLVIDGGANRGQWAWEVVSKFPNLKVLSVEPITEAFSELKSSASKHKNWSIMNVALSKSAGRAVMHVSNNGEQSSSLLKPDVHLMHYPTVGFTRTQETDLVTLDSIQIPQEARVYLKLDLQGNELAALEGGTLLLERVNAIELEVSTVRMYAKQPTFLEIANFLDHHGFRIFTFSDPFRSSDGQCIYFDVIFQKELSNA
jgi:FkbM family methyltransferase